MTNFCTPRIARPGLTHNPLLNSRGGCYAPPDGGPTMRLSAYENARGRAAFHSRGAANSGQSVVAYSTIAALQGSALLRGGSRFAGLRGLGTTPPTSDTIANTLLSFAGEGSALHSSLASAARTVPQIVGIVTAVTDLISSLTNTPDLRVVGAWVRFILAGGSQPTTGPQPEALVTLCAWRVREGTMILGGINLAVTTVSALSRLGNADASVQQAIDTAASLPGFVERLFTSLCSVAPMPPVEQPNCWTLACERGFEKRVDAATGICSCVALTPAQAATRTPYSAALYNYRIAVTSRKLFEGVLLAPTGRLTAGALANNCASSCTLHWASTEMMRVAGTIPSLPGIPAPAGPLRYFDARTAPTACNCRGMRMLVPGGMMFPDSTPSPDAGSPPPPVVRQQSFVSKYKTPLLVGAGVAVLGFFIL